MPVLLIQNAAGDSEIQELSKHVPIAVGRHSSNDVRIDEPDVQVLHCRVSWNSRAYEVVAGSSAGVDVNGKHVSNAVLTLGDCIQVGSVEMFYYDRRSQAEAALRGETVETEEADVEPEPLPAETVQSARRAIKPPVESKPAVELKPPVERKPPVDAKPTLDREDLPARGRVLPPRAPSEYFAARDSMDEIPVEPEVAPLPPPPAPIANLFNAKPMRPGEREIMRSPLVMSLGIGTLVLVLLSLALWIVIGRDTSQKAYQTAIDELEQKRFSQAITLLEEFLKTYPNHSLSSSARHALGLAKVEQPIAGAAPAWDRGLQALDEFVVKHRREKDFPEIVPKVLEFAELIAKGSAEGAGSQKKPELLKVTNNAIQLLQQYSPQDKPPKQALEQIAAAVQKAEADIRKHNTFQTALGQIDASMKAKQPFAVYETRRKLLLKYPDLSSDKTLQSRLQKALDVERELTVRKVLDQPAQTAEKTPSIALPALALIRQTRTRVDTVPGETTVFAVTHETCFAVDSMTGAVRWRRVIGLDSPFPPLSVSLDVQGLLLFDTRENELILVRQRDGGLIWRQSLPEPAAAAPLVHAGQIFIPTRGGKLFQLDAVSGKLTSQLSFSQPPATSPVLVANEERLVLAGDRAVLYTLNYRPLECVAVTYTGHPAGSMKCPPLKMGDFLLTAENDRQNSALLRVWDASARDKPLTQLASDRVVGTVHEPAVLRGKQLVIPSSPERLSAFTVSDEKGEKALAKAGAYQAEHPQGGPIYVTLGPDDDMWMTSSTLRRLQITAESILPQKGELGLGVATQPVQVLDQVLYATSRLPSNSATYFLAADRQQMASQWLSVFGSKALALGTTPANDGSVPLLTDSGDVFSLTAAKLKAGGLDARPATTLPLPPGLVNPLAATVLSNGRLAAWCGGSQPKLWQLNVDGIVSRESKLPVALETAPILLGGGVLLPLPGKLRLIESTEFSSGVEDLMSKIDPAQPARWKGIVALDARQAIAVTNQGRVLRAQVRIEPVAHVAEVAALELKQPVEQKPVLVGNRLFVATAKTLRCLDVATLESRGEIALPDVVTQGPWAVGAGLAMVCGRDQLIVATADPAAVTWQQKLPSGALAGAPVLKGENLLTASQKGEITLRSAAKGETVRTFSVGQPLVLGPTVFQDQTFVTTLDGSLLLLNPWLEAQP